MKRIKMKKTLGMVAAVMITASGASGASHPSDYGTGYAITEDQQRLSDAPNDGDISSANSLNYYHDLGSLGTILKYGILNSNVFDDSGETGTLPNPLFLIGVAAFLLILAAMPRSYRTKKERERKMSKSLLRNVRKIYRMPRRRRFPKVGSSININYISPLTMR
jgi:hypothetical protein